MENVTAEIYTKPSCPYCVKAKALLNEKSIPFKEYIVGTDSTKEQIQEMVDNMGISTTIRTVPQIFLHRSNTGMVEYVGGYTELDKYLQN